MSHSSLLENGRGENRWSSECNAKCIWALLSRDKGRIKFKKSNDVNFCELFPRILFGTIICSIYICTEFVRFISKAFLRFTNEVRPGSV